MRALGAGCLILLLAAFPAASQQFTALKGHGGPVMGIAVNHATGQVATASFDNSIGLWQARTPIWLEGHDAAVNTVLFIGDGGLASAADDFSILLWDLERSGHTRLEGHQGKVMGLALSPDHGILASASWDGSIGIWPLEGGIPAFLQGHQGPVNAVAFRRDGRLFSASADGTVRVWNLETGNHRVLINQGFGINRIALEPERGW